MALRTPPSWLQNGSHPAEQDRLATQGLFRTSGILSAADLAVTQSTVPAMSVQIALGWGNIIGTTQANMGAYQYYNDAAATATITTSDVTNPRIDLICITINDAYYTGVTNNVAINVVAGTPAASPAVPALPANSYALAQVAVAANATSIVNANITDLRVVVSNVSVAGAWTAYTPTVTSTTGTLTTVTATGFYKIIGKLCTAAFVITVTNIGTGSGSLILTLPIAVSGHSVAYFGNLRESASTGIHGTVWADGGGTTMQAESNGPTLIVNGYIVKGSITYETV